MSMLRIDWDWEDVVKALADEVLGRLPRPETATEEEQLEGAVLQATETVIENILVEAVLSQLRKNSIRQRTEGFRRP